MPKAISEAELSTLVQLLLQEEKTVTMYKEGARECVDLGLKELYEDVAQQHKEHYSSLLQELRKLSTGMEDV